jgi:acetoin utilization deacetylase AcuC-like enzyme
LRAAGAVVLGVDLVMGEKVENAFCNIRPPGHHAERARAMGFCIFNNVAVGAAHALAHHGLQRVAIADFDVHHGNGTENIFHDEPRVMLCSTFQHPFYPYRGADSGNEHIINVPLSAGTGGVEFRASVMQHWLPALERFQPELLLISAGFDAHRDDDMAMLKLTEADYAWVTEVLKRIAEKYAQGRIVSALEGGYELHALGRSALAHIKVLTGL